MTIIVGDYWRKESIRQIHLPLHYLCDDPATTSVHSTILNN